MIKIITGHSSYGGSTELLIRLTNLFNDNGYDCTMYGPHTWFLNKCKSDNISNLKFNDNKSDIIISHLLEYDKRPMGPKKIIYYCHEKWWWKRLDKIYNYWDHVVFSHEEHRKWHAYYKGNYSCIPNPKDENLLFKDKSNVQMVAGIIGVIQERKQTHISIQRALDEGCSKIYIFGEIENQKYFDNYIKPYTKYPEVILYGHNEDKQLMYNMIGRVYHSSIGEVACLVKDECKQTGVLFFGSEETNHEISNITNSELFQIWKSLIQQLSTFKKPLL